MKRLKKHPTRIKAGHGDKSSHGTNIPGFLVLTDDHGQTRQEVHPAAGRELQSAKMIQAGYNPGIMGTEDIDRCLPVRKHELDHLLGAGCQGEISRVT